MADGGRLYQNLRGGLYRRLPLLALPLGLLDWRDGPEPGTDGRYFYAPVAWLEQTDPDEARQTLLHSVLHAMLGHPWGRHGRDPDLWSLACDMTAEFLRYRLQNRPLTGPVGKAFYACRDGAAFSARALYDQLRQAFPMERSQLTTLFQRDSHGPWTAANPQTRSAGSGEGDGLHALWARQGQKLRPYLQPERRGLFLLLVRLRPGALRPAADRAAGILRGTEASGDGHRAGHVGLLLPGHDGLVSERRPDDSDAGAAVL